MKVSRRTFLTAMGSLALTYPFSRGVFGAEDENEGVEMEDFEDGAYQPNEIGHSSVNTMARKDFSLLTKLARETQIGNSIFEKYLGKDTTPVLELEDNYKFAVLSDTHLNAKRNVARGIMSAIQTHNPQFVIHTGDLVEKASYSNWEGFFTESKELMRVPFFAIPGNHDDSGDESLNLWKQLWLLPGNQTHYDFVVKSNSGSIKFTGLNTEDNAFKDAKKVESSAQYAWFLERIAREKQEDIRVVFQHRPPFGTESQKGLRTSLVPHLTANGVDINLSGHRQGYQRGNLDGVIYAVPAGAGGSLVDHKPNEVMKFVSKTYNFMIGEFNSGVLTMRDYSYSSKHGIAEIDNFVVANNF